MANAPRKATYLCPLCLRASDIEDSLWHYFLGLFLDDTRPSIKLCWERTAVEAEARGKQWMSYSQCLKRLREAHHRH